MANDLTKSFLETTVSFPTDKFVHELFSEHAVNFPSRVALVEGDRELSYGDLDRITNSLAAELIADGIGADDTVGVYIDRSINYVIAILAVLKSGGCYVPIDPDVPGERLEFIIQDICCKRIFSEARYINELSGHLALTKFLDQIDLSTLKPLTPPVILPHSLAYIIYTSGSTGKPKGVEIEHASLINMVHWYHQAFPEPEYYRATESAAPGFDASVQEFWVHLTNGATIYLIPDALLLQPQKLADWVTEQRISQCFLSTPVAELALSADWSKNTSLKYLSCGGEKLNRKPGAAFPAILANLYGPTECTVNTAWALFKSGEDDGRQPHIGKPVSNFRIYILDENLNAVPRGGQGEICIGGMGLARGYRHLPELTAKSFVADPFLPGQRIYRSGDLGCINEDGNIECLGRRDFQVKIRGYRIELGEIEAVLSRYENISKCVVIAREKTAGIKYLAAYFILKQPQEHKQLVSDLREMLVKSLPQYMIPLTYTVLPELPLTLNGKVDRGALPEPAMTHETPDWNSDDASEPLLQKMALIWCRLLKVDYVSPEDNFFMLGGHSLLATSLVLEIEKLMLVHLPISQVFSHPTLRQLTQAVKHSSGSGRASVKFARVKSNQDNLYPASVTQTSVWMLEKASGVNNLFNIPIEIFLDGEVNTEILISAFNLIVKNNEALRTSFEFINEKLFLRIHPFKQMDIPYFDLAELPEGERFQRHTQQINFHRFQVFELHQPPLFDCTLLKMSAKDYRLIFTVHHLIHDGWSTFLFFKQFSHYYQQLLQGGAPETLPENWRYIDYCAWQNNFFKTYAPQAQLKYWQKKLQNHVLTPPLLIQKNAPSVGRAKRYQVTIPKELADKVKELAVNNNASLCMALTALLQLLIHKYTGATDITTGTSIANRNIIQTKEIMGMFINALALRNNIRCADTFNEFLEQVKNTLLEAYDNQDVPFSTLARSFSNATETDHKTLFNISMLLQNFPYYNTDLSSLKIRYAELGNDTAKMDMFIVFEETAGKICGFIEYDTALFDESGISAFFDHYLHLAEMLTQNPSTVISTIQLPRPAMSVRPTCCIVGETTLNIDAGNILLKNGFVINGIFTEEAKSLDWAKSHDIPAHLPQKRIITEITASVPPDYLFSIISSCIFDQNILGNVRLYAINYHDALLPKYAGLYATAWAVINQEQLHGITWHQITTEIDAGDIFKQQEVAVSPHDTSLTMNIKCSQAALSAFESMVEALKSSSLAPAKQDLSQRTYNAQNKRPADACVIDFSKTIEEISALARALFFGGYDNPLGLPKIAVDGKFYGVAELNIVARKAGGIPGMVVEVNDSQNYLCVNAKNGIVKLQGLHSLTEADVSLTAAGFQSGQIIADNIDRNLLDRYYNECAVSERYWVKRLRSLQLPDIAILDSDAVISAAPVSVIKLAPLQNLDINPLVLFAMFVGRISCTPEFDLAVKPLSEAAVNFPEIFSGTVPLPVTLDFAKSALKQSQALDTSLQAMLSKKTFCCDLFSRYTHIRRLNTVPFKAKITPSGTYEIEFYQQDAAQLAALYQNFCGNLSAAPEQPLGKISILSAAEQNQVVTEWNRTGRDFDLATPFIRQFERQAVLYPDKIAAKSAVGTLTYAALNDRANSLAQQLLSQNPGSGKMIGVLTDKTLEMAIAIIAVFKCGFTYVPLDVQRQSPERIEAMIYDSGAEIILSALRPATPKPAVIPEYVKIIDICSLNHSSSSGAPAPEINISPSDTAYIMYTSGSTGAPKGVMISQTNLLNHNYSVIDAYSLTANDHVLQFSTLGFDISIEEIFPCWLVGATLVFMPEGLLEAPLKLFDFIRREKISFLDLPTSYWHEIAAMVNGGDFPECVRLIAIGGEKASPERFARWKKVVPNTSVINTYGPTETTVIATLGYNPETIGKPLANTRVYVLDELQQPVPVGIEAELYIAGASVATGYLNKPAETAAAFMDDPFNAGDRMYKTGDKVKFNSDGELIFAGRVDDQFKIRGFRVEPGEIETALAGHTDIRTIVVKPWMNEKTGLKSLAAYFVPANPNYNISSIRKFAQEQLPDYMVPAYYVALDSMPMTPNGKINRKALPAPSGAAGADNDLETVIEPQSPLEMQIRLALSKILNKNNIDGNLNLFSIGIDSLSAIKLMLEIQTQTGAKMPVEKLYESKSINAICEYIQSCHGHEQTWSQVVKLASGGNKPPLFLIHTTPGDILGYINLVPRLDNRPVYGIQSLGLNRPEKAHRDIPAMAAQYIEKITLIDPHGPYYLCGWCYGGYVAYEIAQQLTKCGKKVAFLGLIETYPHLRPSFYNYWQRLAAAGEWGIGNYLNYFIFKLKRRLCRDGNIQQLDFVSERFANANNRQEINNMKLVYGYNMDSTDSYYMDYYDGKISLFMVKEQLFGKIPLQKFGWKNLSREIEIFTYDGDHHDILREPVVPIVAADIVQCIANLDK